MSCRRLIRDTGRELLSSGFTVATWGNLSCRKGERVYITPSGMDYRTLHKNDVVITDLEGNILKGRRRPSTELPLHLAIYRARPEVRAIVHTHAAASTAFACAGEEIPLVTDEAAQTLGDVCRCADYALPGSRELAESCVRALGERSNACLLQSHGAVCVGPDMARAFLAARVLEATAEILTRLRSMSLVPRPIAPEDIRAMQTFMSSGYGQK